LIEKADRDPFFDGDLTGVGGLLTDEESKDGRLTGAVGAYEANPFAWEHSHIGVEEQDLASMTSGDGIELDHRGAEPGRNIAAGKEPPCCRGQNVLS
jgi:hypothetical protein